MEKKELLKEYFKRKKEICARLKKFKKAWNSEKKVFEELLFCICTPQSKAEHCDAAVKQIIKSNNFCIAAYKEIAQILKPKARFHNQKAKRIVEAGERFHSKGKPELKKFLIENRILENQIHCRNFLAKRCFKPLP